jgi:hypothetical protein
MTYRLSTTLHTIAKAIARVWHWLTTTPYTRLLEQEVERLRTENVALRASVFGMQGVPGQRYREFLAASLAQQQEPPQRWRAATDSPALSDRPLPANLDKPQAVRRPPWSITKRKLEIEDARKAYQAR